ncbi:MAG: branched-chain amino acid transport system ATP-binding protein [Desulforhopalus sp.]|jgi:branched-chain amino acid transport system ATP-binding protein
MTETLLEVTHLHKSFGALKATDDLNFSIKRGHIHALIGPNGAGKTTAVNQLSGDLLPDSGSIHFNGTQITRLAPHKRAKLGLARSYQITSIFDELTVAENMTLAILAQRNHNFRFWRKADKTRRVLEELPAALDRVDLSGRKDFLSANLSHGEKRQLEVGMSLVGKPELLILDEPMAGMGPGGTIELSKLIQSLKGDLTILLVEHDMNVVFALADMITVLVNGQNIATGPPNEIRTNLAVRKAYLGEEE